MLNRKQRQIDKKFNLKALATLLAIMSLGLTGASYAQAEEAGTSDSSGSSNTEESVKIKPNSQLREKNREIRSDLKEKRENIRGEIKEIKASSTEAVRGVRKEARDNIRDIRSASKGTTTRALVKDRMMEKRNDIKNIRTERKSALEEKRM